jgi:hypothetical protein
VNQFKSLFVPLKTRYFRAFEDGTKTTEYRRYGPRWNERTCAVGRPVVLSLGYSGARLIARVASVRRVLAAEVGSEIYPPETLLAAIDLEEIAPIER